MPIISKEALAAKNNAGNGLRNNDNGKNKANNAAIKKLADILGKAAAVLGEEDEALQWSINDKVEALKTIVSTPIKKANLSAINRSLKTLDDFDDRMNHRDYHTKRSVYEEIVSVLGKVGSSKEELDSLLGTANGVLELGLEKSILKPVDPAEQKRREEEQRR